MSVVRPLDFVISASYVDADECLNWPFCKNPAGYGRLHYDGQAQLAYRIVCEIAHGAAPDNAPFALHTCGVAHCVNARHLRWGSQTENMADRVTHGTSNRGEQSANAKLSKDQVRRIKSRLRRQETPQQLAAAFNVSDSTIRSIASGRSWFWLLEEADDDSRI